MGFVLDYLKKIEAAYVAGNSTEHTHRPALKELVENLGHGIVATNEPQRVKCGAPDLIITKGHTPLGYIESKDIGKSLSEAERSDQLKRYLESLGNLILTDYLEFRWYVGGQHRMTARLASVVNGKLKVEKNGISQVEELLKTFILTVIPTVTSPKELAIRLSAVARLIRDTIQRAFEEEDITDDESDPLHDQLEGFRKVLIHDLTPEQFADMYAQTICYGLFAARCNADPKGSFTREHASYDLPKTNPFLRKMFNYVAGPDLDDRVVWAVDDIAELLNHTDIEAILKDFGKRTRQEDPVVHFYESFLAAYDPKMRESRGVYYTPEPVVSYIVRSVDHILKTDFKLPAGLADSSKIKVQVPGTKKHEVEVHKVQILDPAAGTGTFLHGVIDQIHGTTFREDKGMWSSYVHDHLLPRLFGFEILMAPYAVAHMKLGLQLKELGYDFKSSERIRVYLTNTLEEAHAMSGLPLFTQWIAEEANAASDVKKDTPVMVVLGNPPYSGHSANVGAWINSLLKGKDIQSNQKTGSYFEVDGQSLGEKNSKWLHDDYVKFIRFAQWRLEQTGYGVFAFITNHGYLDNPTFRGMRQSLLQAFDDIYILNLHGNSKRKEHCPDGSRDENVFDIQQGVAIGIFIKRTRKKPCFAAVYHADLWGISSWKYHWLWENSISSTQWKKLVPNSPYYLFVPQNALLLEEYNANWKITDVFPVNSVNFRTHRDALVIDMERDRLINRINMVNDNKVSENDLREILKLRDTRDWSLLHARVKLNKIADIKSKICICHYRPFDFRWIFYDDSLVEYPCYPVVGNFRQVNMGFTTTRQTTTIGFEHILATKYVTELKCISHDRGGYSFPLYIYPSKAKEAMLFEDKSTTDSVGDRKSNLSPNFIEDFATKLNMQFVQDGKGNSKFNFGPEDILSYIYAIFYSPTYRSRYAEFLKIDFPRLPLTSKPELFRELCSLGDELVAVHLMEKHASKITSYPVAGDNAVEKVRYQDPHAGKKGQIWINSTQYFEGVPKDVWEFHVGGYQVCDKWLKDRKGRQLTYDDLTHYQHVVAALSETIQLMAKIDMAIDSNGGWPLD